MRESGREVTDWSNAFSKPEMGEGGWEAVDGVVELALKRKMGERGWEGVD